MARVVVCAALLLGAGAALAQPPRHALERLFTAPTIERAFFDDSFLQAVPIERVRSLVSRFLDRLGAFEDVRGDASPFTLVFDHGTAQAQIAVDDRGRITGLRLQSPTRTSDDVSAAVDALERVGGRVALWVGRDGRALANRNADRPMAVGSAFKLAVLAAAADAVSRGEHRWDEVVRLRASDRSLPSGRLQRWPVGSPVTLHTLAVSMISESDNTAADALVRVLGKEAVEAQAPALRPLLTTREAFQLKTPAHASERARYLDGDPSRRRAVVEGLDGAPLPDAGEVSTHGRARQIEWFLSARTACDLIARVADLDVFDVEPGPASGQGWQRVAYKGGSEPGVLNLTTLVTSDDGTSTCVALTVNRSEGGVARDDAVERYRGLLAALAGR